MSEIKKIAFFDFDGTLTTKDTLFDFLFFFKGYGKTFFGLIILLPMLLSHKLGLIDARKAKEYLFTYFFKEMHFADFKETCERYAHNKIPKILNLDVLMKFQDHISKGHKVVIVTASLEDWVKPWATSYGVEVIGSNIEVCDGKITGKLACPNCNGFEKVNRIKLVFDLKKFDYIYAYGNSKGDLPMLKLANAAFYKKF